MSFFRIKTAIRKEKLIMEKKKKRIFLLLPELNKEIKISSLSSCQIYSKKYDGYVLLNVYEHYRQYMNSENATRLALDILEGFDELWYSGAFGITEPMYYLIKKAKQLNLPIKDLQPINPKESFSLAYKFAMEYHPCNEQNDEYWKNLVQSLGKYSENNNPLNNCLLKAIFDYYEEIYKNLTPKISAKDHFNQEFKTGLSFTMWALKNNAIFNDGIDPKKVSKNPTPMLKALISGIQEYYQEYQRNLKANKLKNKKVI